MRPDTLKCLLALAVALALASAVKAAPADLEASLAALRQAAAEHPDDPDYSWAVASALEAAGRPLQAAAIMRAHLARWPERPAAGWRALGRCEYRAGRFELARDALTEAARRDARDAEAQLYLGLSLQALGERDQAERHLEAAAELDPALAGDALLLSGISHMARGEADRGRELLERVIAIAPRSDSARQARALTQPAAPTRSAFDASAYTGVRYDSNVSIEDEGELPGTDLPDVDEADDAVVDFGTRLAWRPSLRDGERQPLELSVGYHRSDYVQYDEFSSQRAIGGAAWTQSLHRLVALQLYGGGSYSLLDDEPYLLSGTVQPSLFVGLGGRRGVVRVHGIGEYLDYDEDPAIPSLERSGWEYGGGAEHVLSLGREGRGGWFAWGGSYIRRNTVADRDAAGFRSAYDSDSVRATTRALVKLPFEVSARGDVWFDAELFEHHNVVAALTELDFTERRDYAIGSSVSLRRPLFRGIELELLASFEDLDSNVAIYDSRRTTAGMRLHAAFP